MSSLLRLDDRIVQASWAGTGLFVVSSGVAAAARPAAPVALGVALALFAVGVACYGVALGQAVARSRLDDISVSGLFFLMGGVAPRPVSAQLLGSWVVEVVAAVATAGVRVNSSLAFGILAPVYGLALTALWAARRGKFPRRATPSARRGREGGPTRTARPAARPGPSPRTPGSRRRR